MIAPFHAISDPIKQALQEKFSDRVSFDIAERFLYSHDLGSPPALLGFLIKWCIAEGVVQPRNEEELVYLLRLADRHKVPLTPRGRGTSGYGGAIPRYGGLVVDFSRMNKILAVDPEKLTATVEPGVIWLDLERELATGNLALRLYPGSAPTSTVAGWLAQGGSGFGSYAYGWFGENVIGARVVQPGGKIVTYTADELDLVRDAEGITGFITEVTLKIMQTKPLEVLAASFKTAGELVKLLQSVVEHKLKLWSVNFINPEMGKLKENLFAAGSRSSVIRGTYLVIFVFPRIESKSKKSLYKLIDSHQGRVLEQELSDKLWGERFDILKIKKTATSLIPSKVVLPLESLNEAFENISRIEHPLGIEGVILQDKNKQAQVVLLAFIPYNERKISYPLVYSLSLSFIILAGGKPCATGIYFKWLSYRILGSERRARLISEKKKIDRNNILNPGKVITSDILDQIMGQSWYYEPLSRSLANLLRPAATGSSQNNDPGVLSWYAYSCDQCGFCRNNCPSFHGWDSQSQRGRWYLLRLVRQGKLKPGQVIKKFQPCRECDVCKVACPQGLPPIILEMPGGEYERGLKR